MKKFAMMSLLALMWICWVPQQSAAETRKLYGYVTDVNNEPLVGVSVRVYRTAYVTVTDAKGRYQLGGDWARGGNNLVHVYRLQTAEVTR